MEKINELYSEYCTKRSEIKDEYNKKVREIKDKILKNCFLKEGMVVKFDRWVGRLKMVDFVEVLDEHHLQAVLIDSETLTRITIDERDFRKVEILKEPKVSLNMELINEGVARLEKEIETYKEEVKHIAIMHANRVKELRKDLSVLRKGCIHDWRVVKSVGNGALYECSICKETYIKH